MQNLTIDKKSPKKGLKSKKRNQTCDDSDFLASIVQFSDDAIIGMDMDGKIKTWNRAAEKMFGYSTREILGKSVNILYPPEHEEELSLIIKKINTGESLSHFETERKRKDGKIINVSLSFSPIKDKNFKLIGFSKIVRDFTGQRSAFQYTRSLIEASLDPLVTISPEGKITDVNEATVEAIGASRTKLIGTDFSNYFTEPYKAKQGYQQVLKEGFVRDYPLAIRHISGKTTDVLYNASVYKDNEGNVLGVFAAARDITAQKQAWQYARSLIEASLDPFVTISPEGKITDVNEATVQVTGVARDELIGSDFSNYFTEPEEAQEGYQQVLKEGFVRDYPLAIRHVSGEVTDVLYNAILYKDTGGKVQGIFAAARDITKRKRAEQQLHATSAYVRSLIETSIDPFVTISPEGKVTDVNEATVQITGVSREWLIGTDFSDYFTEPHKARQGYRKAFKEGFVRDYPLAIRHTSGKTIDVLYNASIYKDNKGNVLGVFAVARDYSKLKFLTEQHKELEAFSYSISHDLRNPLRSIELFVQLLQKNYKDKLDAEGDNYLEHINTECNHMMKLIDDMIQLSNVGKSDLNIKTVNLSEIANNIAENFKIQNPERKVDFIIANELIEETDEAVIKIILQNLFDNAWKFTNKKEMAVISFEKIKLNNETVYFVRDNGVGFNMEYSEKIFEPFKRLHSDTEFPGTGIGLATVSRAINRLGGRIWAEAIVDNGATFYFTLP